MSSVYGSRGVIASIAALMICGLVALTPGQAAAAPHAENPPAVQIGYTDLMNPRAAYDVTGQQDVPLGVWRGGASPWPHLSRVYATFDLTRLIGRPITGGTVQFRESAATDCTKRAIEIWQTRVIDRTPSWLTAPAELRRLDQKQTAESCPGVISLDVSAAVKDAVAHQKNRVSFEIRVPAGHEWDIAYGRQLSRSVGVGLTVAYNDPPKISLRNNGGFPCAESAPFPALTSIDTLQALATDADDPTGLHYEFAVWPRDEPAARTVLTADGTTARVGTVHLPAGVLADGRTYSWQVRVGDGAATSPWSGVCSFAVDRSSPATPTVTSANYPPENSGRQTPPGELGVFTFTATDSDTAGFQYGWSGLGVPQGCNLSGEFGQTICPDPLSGPGTVRADRPGGTATVSLTPPDSGPAQLVVRSIDRAGNVSEQVSYHIAVPYTGPTITLAADQPAWGEQVVLRFTPHQGITGTVAFEYQLETEDWHTVLAGPDGTATASVPTSPLAGHQPNVRSRSANGWVSSSQTAFGLSFLDLSPSVSADVYLSGGDAWGGVGRPGTFTFFPPVGGPEVGSYEYSFNGAAPVSVPADAQGRATITWAPETSGSNYLEVSAILKDGTPGDFFSNFYPFEVG